MNRWRWLLVPVWGPLLVLSALCLLPGIWFLYLASFLMGWELDDEEDPYDA